MSPRGLPVLTYHSIDTSGSVISTNPSWFAEAMSALSGAGFRSVDLEHWVASGRAVGEQDFAITFDDGLRSIQSASDVLTRLGFSATVFVVTGRIATDNRWPGQPIGVPVERTLDWSELAGLQAAGFRIGSHTVSHASLHRLGTAGVQHELRQSRDEIEQRLGRACGLLSYPYGRASRSVQRAAACLYDAAFGTRLGLASQTQSRFNLSRIDACYLRSERALERLISGRLKPWLRVRRALREARGLATACLGN